MKIRKIVAMALTACLMVVGAAQADVWNNVNVPFKGGTVRVIVQDNMLPDMPRVEWLIGMADRSTVTEDPLGSSTTAGMMQPGDIICVNEDMLMWFDATWEAGSHGGVGLIQGLWEIKRDATGNHNFKRITNGHNYSPNLLYPGSTPGVTASGMALLGNYNLDIDNGDTWGMEADSTASISPFTGTDTPAKEVYIQFVGHIANSDGTLSQYGIDSRYDTDARPGVEGRTGWTLTYRVPYLGTKFRQEVSCQVNQNNFGPVSTYVISACIAGYEDSTISWVADPSLTGGQYDYSRDYTQYFSMPGKTLKFYKKLFADHSNPVSWGETPTPMAAGSVAGVGCPAAPTPAPFITADVVMIPSQYTASSKFQCIDNRQIGGIRVNALDFKGEGLKTFGQGSNIYTIIDYEIK